MSDRVLRSSIKREREQQEASLQVVSKEPLVLEIEVPDIQGNKDAQVTLSSVTSSRVQSETGGVAIELKVTIMIKESEQGSNQEHMHGEGAAVAGDGDAENKTDGGVANDESIASRGGREWRSTRPGSSGRVRITEIEDENGVIHLF